MGYMMVHGPCVGCGVLMSYNAERVPSLVLNGEREPLCRDCFDRWNKIHRTSKGLPPEPINPDAYNPLPVD